MGAEKKIRLDQALLQRGLAPDLKEAQARIMAGAVYVGGQKSDKPDRRVAAADAITLRSRSPYVSRGALKIARAVESLAIALPGLKVLDIGISTGGFSDFFLQHGAAAVFGVDVTISQVDSRLRADPRLRLLEKNARFLRKEDVPFDPDLVVMDLSFISITAVLPVLAAFPGARVLALVKPQFEAARGRVGRGGVIRERQERLDILLRIKRRIEDLEFAVLGFSPAGVKGRKGNQEFFFLLQRGKNNSISDKMIRDADEI
ncbi:MAG: TlyA family RNA methyltransferase [Acidobacteria bacterium]|jgi:23S rRNA (cytidine1920-2'-O)/16S rRNA (cytidine1409-2'-O)-methyltransferase|nr:TlyA family RNA methyltransferase [Acidobacteriota bacterium]